MARSDAPKAVRWRSRLQPYDFPIEHIPRANNVVVDAFSRCLKLTNATEVERFHNAR